jgi:hypothetical protein
VTEANVRTALAASAGAVAVNAQKITGLADGVNPQDGVTVAQLTALQTLIDQNVLLQCGDGSDGALDFNGGAVAGCTLVGTVYTATRPLQATTINIRNGYTLSCDGWLICFRDTFYWDGLVLILAKNGAGTTPGAASWTSSARPLYPGSQGGAGKSGGAGNGTGGSGASPAFGGSGGKGGNSGANTGGGGGAASYPAGYQPNGIGWIGVEMQALVASNGITQLRSAAGGGGGAADATGVGGGGGGGAGICVLRGRAVVIGATATLSCAGGNGANAGAVNAGGGGGGGGGHFRIICHESIVGALPTAAVSCPGGTPGNGSGTGLVGVVGNAGTVDVIYF